MQSKNKITISQSSLACQHVKEMRAAGISENLAIRTLELFVEVYSQLQVGSSASPYNVNKVELWSIDAKALKRRLPSNAKPGRYFRIEHGTPRRTLARIVLDLHNDGKLTEKTMIPLVRKLYKVAVITLDEDKSLNKFAGQEFKRPDDRWKAAGISFPTSDRD